MKSKLSLVFLLFFLISLGCKTPGHLKQGTASGTKVNIPVREYSIQSVLWQQQSAEYRALSYQAFNLAKLQLDNILQSANTFDKPLAIVTDVDETVIDNSPFNAKMIELDEEFTEARWLEWGKEKKATALPGALAFFQYAQSKGVEVFYISNRTVVQQKETMANLQQLGFPFIDDAHMLLKTTTSAKEPRRSIVRQSHQIVLLLGDNLSDFSSVFDGQSTQVRNDLVDNMRDEFGTTFIVFPNPMYGDWETKGIYEKKYNWTPAQRDSIRRSKIISY